MAASRQKDALFARGEALIARWANGERPAGAGERLLSGALRGASGLYAAGAAARSFTFDAGLRKPLRIDCPVVSVGNLSVGGTGKTPMVLEIARMLREAGARPAVVSRGYRREDENTPLIVSDGVRILAGPAEAGDEPWMMARLLRETPVVVGARRYEAALLARRRCGADVVVLDDGFQHRALARDCDIVLWDALRPADSAALLPRGLLREGLGALKRADAVVFTRCNLGARTRGVMARMKRIAPHLAIFHSELRPGDLRALEDRTQRVAPGSLRGEAVAAFCGLGNPQSFWRLLESLGVRLVASRTFPDHHRPSPEELDRFSEEARRAGAVLTALTEKDAGNLPEGWRPDPPAYVLPVRTTFGEDQERFEAFLRRRAGL